MIKVVAKNFAKEEKLQEVTALYKELVEETRKEEGCLVYEVYQDEKDATVIAIIEEWENKEYLQRHMNSEHFTRIVPQLGNLMRKERELNIYNKLI